MRLIALDTSTAVASVAVLDGDHLTAREGVAGGPGSTDLLGLIEATLATAGLALAAVDGFAVGAGPGSFTGLRIAMATAKGLAFATGKPLHAVSSLAALALDAAPLAGPGALVVPLLDARRDEVYAGFYRLAAAGVVAVADERVIAPADLAAVIATVRGDAPAVALAGDGVPLVSGLGLGDALITARATPSAASVARLAAAGLGVDGMRSGPSYLRKAEVEIRFPDGNPGTRVEPKG